MSRQSVTRPLVAEVQSALRDLSLEIDRLDSLAAERFGLNRTDLRCLDLLRRHATQTPTDLARALGLTTGGMTTVVDRLEHAGYVRRRPDPDDRRRITLEGTRLLARRETEIFGRLIESTVGLIATYSDADLATISDFLRRSRETTAAHSESLQKAHPAARRR
jgi:DNA-binding MarR family transcriptional regulator